MLVAGSESVVELDEAIRDEMCRMKRTVGYGDNQRIPDPIYRFLRDLCRDEPRIKRPMGQYPQVVDALAPLGVPWSDLFAPVNRLKGLVWNRHFATSLPCIMEAVSRETEANHRQNHATHRMLRDPRNDHLDSFIESCDVQIAETRLARSVAVAMRMRAD